MSAVTCDVITNGALFEVLYSNNFMSKVTSTECHQFLTEHIRTLIKLRWLENDVFLQQIQQRVKGFATNLKSRWTNVKSVNAFRIKYAEWLKNTFNINFNSPLSRKEVTKRGRPRKLFSDGSERTKRRLVEDLERSSSEEELVFATKRVLHKTGRRSAAHILSQVTEYSPKRATRIKKMLNSSSEKPIPYTANQALALFVDLKLNKETYIGLRLGAKRQKANIYPAYQHITEAKKKCYPEGITINEYGKYLFYFITFIICHQCPVPYLTSHQGVLYLYFQ